MKALIKVIPAEFSILSNYALINNLNYNLWIKIKMMKKVLTSYSTLVKGKVDIVLCTGNVSINTIQHRKTN